MSRIIVKNLPNNITEDKLKGIFGEKGLITDVQLKYTPSGKFRKFGFIGFQNEGEATEAIQHFNNTRINTSKITVEACALLGDTNKPKSWSKYSSDSSVNQKSKKVQEEETKPNKDSEKEQQSTKNLLKQYKDDPMFEEFLHVHNNNAAKKLLESAQKNVDSSDESEKAATVIVNTDDGGDSISDDDDDQTDKLADKTISDIEYMKSLMKQAPRQKTEKKQKEKIELFTVKLKNLPYNCKKKDIKGFFKPLTPYTIRIPRNVKGFAYVGFKLEKNFNKALLKNRSIIGGKQISVLKYTTEENPVTQQPDNPVNNKWKSQEQSLKNEEDIAESGRIFIRNLTYTTTENDIQKLFEQHGPVSELNFPIDKETRKIKGFGVVTFLMPEHAVKAYSALDGSILHGRMLHLLPAKPKDNAEEDGDESSNYKQKKTKQQKAQASSSHNWNSLFLGHNAVAEVIADTYNTTKAAVLDPHGSGSAAVRLALGETQIVANTRKCLEEQGVFLDAFKEVSGKRSKTIILVKNLPANTEKKELIDLFQPHGEIGRIIFPPSAISAIIEFLEPTEARTAFRKLAYTKFKNLPLYLEWAPENSFSSEYSATTNKSSHKLNMEQNKNVDETITENGNVAIEEEDEEEPEDDTTLFVKNLNFKTTDQMFRKHFEECGKIHYATVATKNDKNDPKMKLSMGYGFIRFTYKSSADKALKVLQHSSLDGKSLELKRSERTLQNVIKTTRKATKLSKQTGTKILVRNIPFEANRKEIMELFKTFGEIKALRLPKKMTIGADSHRGFAFVDFATNSDAKKAFEALSQSTHLYGRRLVLEWASAEEGVDELRKRTADHFHETQEVKSKKSIFDMDK